MIANLFYFDLFLIWLSGPCLLSPDKKKLYQFKSVEKSVDTRSFNVYMGIILLFEKISNNNLMLSLPDICVCVATGTRRVRNQCKIANLLKIFILKHFYFICHLPKYTRTTLRAKSLLSQPGSWGYNNKRGFHCGLNW